MKICMPASSCILPCTIKHNSLHFSMADISQRALLAVERFECVGFAASNGVLHSLVNVMAMGGDGQ